MTTKKIAAPELIAQQEYLFGRAVTETPALVTCLMGENGVMIAQLRTDAPNGSIANVVEVATQSKKIIAQAVEGMTPEDPEFVGLLFVSHCPEETPEIAKLALAELGDALGYRVLSALHVSGGLIHNLATGEIYPRIDPGTMPTMPAFSNKTATLLDRVTAPSPEAGEEVYKAMAMGQAWAVTEGNTRNLVKALTELADKVADNQASPADLHRMTGILRYPDTWATALVSILDPDLGAHGNEDNSLEGFLYRGITPDWERVDRIQEALTQMAELAPARASAPVLSALAWIQWCKGRSTMANELLEMSFELAPEYGDESFIQTLGLLFKSGTLSPVAVNSATAYRGKI
ncbi:hypothetical protein [Glutamicibacter sp. NPDC090743]|uniref:hypothetical protein n=1 Tax=Glutamicibacter sp. NPDC090743 TaxID=3364001 RepID=UPI0037FF97F3